MGVSRVSKFGGLNGTVLAFVGQPIPPIHIDATRLVPWGSNTKGTTVNVKPFDPVTLWVLDTTPAPDRSAAIQIPTKIFFVIPTPPPYRPDRALPISPGGP